MPSLLVDVRSPGEYAGGYLYDAVNIEYTQIHALTTRPGLDRGDDITLYCQSGRRSAIALQELRRLGFSSVRDLGNLSTARRTLDFEHESDQAPKTAAASAAATSTAGPDVRRAYDALLAGLDGGDDGDDDDDGGCDGGGEDQPSS